MDADRFDWYTRSLTATSPRSGFARTLGGLSLIGLLGPLLVVAEAEAKNKKKKGKHKKKKRCKGGTKTCGKRCIAATRCCSAADCGSGGSCTGGSCSCTTGFRTCQGRCIPDTACCAADCGPCESCQGPDCVYTCQSHQACVGGRCQCTAASCDGCCGSDGLCGACLVFVSSSGQNGNLGGLDGADEICQRLASAPAANLPGTYRAWLSDVSGSPSTRFQQSAQPYRRADGVIVADNWTDLTDGTLDNPINVTETGELIGSDSFIAWSNTAGNGTSKTTDEDCNDWTADTNAFRGRQGGNHNSDVGWTDLEPANFCNDPIMRLYCFQQD
jgi:hypothetical protein